MRRRNVNQKLIIIIGSGALLVLLGLLGFLKPVGSVVSSISRPFTGAISGVSNGVGNWFSTIGDARNLGSENQQLRSQVASLQQQLSQTGEIRAQNDELRKQLGVGSIRANRLIAAEVVSYQPDNFRQFITIGRGSRDGIRVGMAVVQQGNLVGTISEVSATTSKVFLVIDPSFRVAALDQDSPNRANGTIHGQIGSGLVMDKIAQTDSIKPGDTIVTSGLGNDIEKGLIIGHIQTVNKQDNGVFQSAQVTTEVQFNRLEIVYVIARPQ
jgi:rod shape-determining protein MreC